MGYNKSYKKSKLKTPLNWQMDFVWLVQSISDCLQETRKKRKQRPEKNYQNTFLPTSFADICGPCLAKEEHSYYLFTFIQTTDELNITSRYYENNLNRSPKVKFTNRKIESSKTDP